MIMSTKEICKRGLSVTISLTLGNTAFPFGDGLPRYAHPFGQGFLGPAQGAPGGGQLPAPFCCGHTVHLPFWFQHSIFLRRLQATPRYFPLPRAPDRGIACSRPFLVRKGPANFPLKTGRGPRPPARFCLEFLWFAFAKKEQGRSPVPGLTRRRRGCPGLSPVR